MRLLLATMAVLADPSVKPWPIGPGPRYVPAPAPAAILAGRPAGSLRCGSTGTREQAHIELFAGRRVIVVPAGIGIAEPLRRTGATVAALGCSYPVRTLAPDGVVEMRKGTTLTVGDLFRVWGQPLGARRLASFRSASPVRAYVNGRPFAGSASSVPLRAGDEIVLEVGPYVAPHSFFLFPGGSR